MKHHDKKRKLGRPRGQRIALMRSLALSLIKHGKITTTEAKAKELRPYIDRLVTKAKAGSVASRRLLLSRLYNQEKAVSKLISELAPKYSDRNGGYTRVLKLSTKRKGDASGMAVIEFV